MIWLLCWKRSMLLGHIKAWWAVIFNCLLNICEATSVFSLNFLIVSSFAYYFQVLYIEACESGSIFEGLLPKGLNIYATTASNAEESSWGTYCPGEYPSPPPEYETCLGDLYAVSWMEDRYMQLLNFTGWFWVLLVLLLNDYEVCSCPFFSGFAWNSW